MIGTGVSG